MNTNRALNAGGDAEELPRISSPPSVAGGAPAVYHAMRHVWTQSGVLRGGKALSRLNQKNGFDCPSCAWPDPDGERSPAEFCENGAKAVASETTRRRVDRAFFERYTIDDLLRRSDHWLEQQGRLTEPMVKRAGSNHYEPIAWDEAFALIGHELRALSSPDEAIFYTSGRASNEAAFVYQLFARSFGTNNLPDCSNMCHESSGVALKESIGVGKGTVSLEDLRQAQLIWVIGQNPGTNHPRMLSTLQQAKENGASIVSINPLREAGLVAFAHPQRPGQVLGGRTPLADRFIRVALNGDQALFRGVAKRLVEWSELTPTAIDAAFIGAHTLGFQAYRRQLEATTWSDICELSGLSQDVIDGVAEMVAQSERFVSCWAMGLTQHRNSVATLQELTNVHLLRGAIGRKGAGLCPVRGHSNVQGDRTMGICESMPEAFLQRLDQACSIVSPRKEGLNTVRAIAAMRERSGKVFFALGGNFVSACPDTEFTAAALKRCRLTAQVSTKLNRSHLVVGEVALILPCLGRSETDAQASGAQWVSVENSMGIVHASTGTLEPASPHLQSETAIVCGAAKATLGDRSRIDWLALRDDYRRIRALIEQVIPGFDDYDRKARQPGGFYLPNAAKERRFETASGKANFAYAPLAAEQPGPGRLLLMTIRSHDQFNTTVYGLDDRYRGIKGGRKVVLMNEGDIARLGLSPGAFVDVHSDWGEARRSVCNFQCVAYDIPLGVAAMYFPEANVLVPFDHVADRSETPASKSVPVTVVASDSGRRS